MTRLGQPHNGYFSERWWPWKLSPSPAQDHSWNALLLLPLWFSIAAAAVLRIATDEFSSSSLSFPGWRSEKKSPCEVVCLTLVFSSTVFLALLLKWLGIQKRFQLSTPPWGAQTCHGHRLSIWHGKWHCKEKQEQQELWKPWGAPCCSGGIMACASSGLRS